LLLKNAATLNTASALVTGNGVGVEQFDTAALTVQNSEIQNNATNAVAAGGLALNAGSNWWARWCNRMWRPPCKAMWFTTRS